MQFKNRTISNKGILKNNLRSFDLILFSRLASTFDVTLLQLGLNFMVTYWIKIEEILDEMIFLINLGK